MERPVTGAAREVLMLAWLVACTQPDPTRAPAPSASDTSTPPSTRGTGDTAASTGDTGPVGVVFDCEHVPTEVQGITEVAGARGYHDVEFPDDGTIVGNSAGNANLLKADVTGASQIWVPGTGTIEQMVLMPGGEIAVASSTYGIAYVYPNGGSSVLNGNIFPYGLVLGPDGKLWAADQDQVHRVDPVTGDAEVVVPRFALPSGAPRVIAFSVDDTKLYVGTLGGSQGRIFQVPLDATFDPAGPPTVFASGVGSGGYHDGIGVDLCGYLYVPDYDTSSLYRVTPDGNVVQRLLEASGLLHRDYVHGLEWGRPEGGWRDDAIYAPQPYDGNKVQEIVIGVPSRSWTGGVAINRP